MGVMIELVRTYRQDLTVGRIFFNDVALCQSIELPWMKNVPNVSCIPEGSYTLQHQHTEKYGDHLLVEDVPGRKYILLHPANHAKEELRGCIAPVMEIKGVYGIHSRAALNILLYNIRQTGIHMCHFKISSL